jgi:glycolate oxidase FAD binding subunit
MREAASRARGHATLFRAERRAGEAFSPLGEVQMRVHRELKAVFDPAGILNPGRLYAAL